MPALPRLRTGIGGPVSSSRDRSVQKGTGAHGAEPAIAGPMAATENRPAFSGCRSGMLLTMTSGLFESRSDPRSRQGDNRRRRRHPQSYVASWPGAWCSLESADICTFIPDPCSESLKTEVGVANRGAAVRREQPGVDGEHRLHVEMDRLRGRESIDRASRSRTCAARPSALYGPAARRRDLGPLATISSQPLPSAQGD
jgi:hypothetical protein